MGPYILTEEKRNKRPKWKQVFPSKNSYSLSYDSESHWEIDSDYGGGRNIRSRLKGLLTLPKLSGWEYYNNWNVYSYGEGDCDTCNYIADDETFIVLGKVLIENLNILIFEYLDIWTF